MWFSLELTMYDNNRMLWSTYNDYYNHKEETAIKQFIIKRKKLL